jgi:hypothetical protein
VCDASLLEKLIGRRLRDVLGRHVGFKPSNFIVEQGDTLGQFANREQCEVLPDLVNDLLFRPVVFVDGCHGLAPEQSPKITARETIVTSGQGD